MTKEQTVNAMENSITKVTVELRTVLTPNSKRGNDGFATPKNTPKPKSTASSHFALRKPTGSGAQFKLIDLISYNLTQLFSSCGNVNDSGQ